MGIGQFLGEVLAGRTDRRWRNPSPTEREVIQQKRQVKRVLGFSRNRLPFPDCNDWPNDVARSVVEKLRRRRSRRTAPFSVTCRAVGQPVPQVSDGSAEPEAPGRPLRTEWNRFIFNALVHRQGWEFGLKELGAMPTALRGHGVLSAGSRCSLGFRFSHAHAKPWAWHPKSCR